MRVEANSLSFRRPSLQMENVSLSLDHGSILAIMGKNGSGKTTLLKILHGDLKPLNGEVLINGKNLSEYSSRDISRAVSFVHQEIYDPISFTVRDVMEVSGYSRNASKAEMDSALRTFRIGHLVDKDFSKLSGGERRLVTLAGALYQGSQIMLLDEPTNFLDIDNELLVLNVLKKLRNSGVSVIIVTHNMHAVSRIADYTLLLRNGRIISQGRTSDVLVPRFLNQTFGVDFQVHDTADGPVFSAIRY